MYAFAIWLNIICLTFKQNYEILSFLPHRKFFRCQLSREWMNRKNTKKCDWNLLSVSYIFCLCNCKILTIVCYFQSLRIPWFFLIFNLYKEAQLPWFVSDCRLMSIKIETESPRYLTHYVNRQVINFLLNYDRINGKQPCDCIDISSQTSSL